MQILTLNLLFPGGGVWGGAVNLATFGIIMLIAMLLLMILIMIVNMIMKKMTMMMVIMMMMATVILTTISPFVNFIAMIIDVGGDHNGYVLFLLVVIMSCLVSSESLRRLFMTTM